MCVLTGYTFCIPINFKFTSDVVRAYIDYVYSKFVGPVKILTGSQTEFKNESFTIIEEKIWVEHKINAFLYHPLSNGRMEGFHSFLKACISKHVSKGLEWDDIVQFHIIYLTYSFFPNKH